MIGHRIFGKGPIKVIGCHGWFGSSFDWSAMEPAFDADRFTFAWLDQRGYGLSKDVRGEFTIDEVAADVIDLASGLDWKRFHLIGHSMGAKVVQRVVQRKPSEVASVTAITPVPASGVPLDDATYQFFAGAAGNDEVRRGLVSYSVSDRHPTAWVHGLVSRSRESSTENAFGTYLASWARGDFSEDINGISVPMLVLVGEHDPALRPELMEATFMRWYPRAQLEVISNSGHYPMWETPIDLAGRIQRFILRIES
jgi:pimeloyl-ACP methyl ester carboxylesterase